MKPFTTPELMPNGKRAFRYQCEGVDCGALGRLLEGRKLVAYVLPEGHTLQVAWELSFAFESGFVLEFSSACTEVAEWQEVGSLNIRLTHLSTPAGTTTVVTHRSELQPIDVVWAEKLIYEDQDVVVECGLVLRGGEGQEVVIAAGIPPGSVSVRAPFSPALFEPQFPLPACRREPVGQAKN